MPSPEHQIFASKVKVFSFVYFTLDAVYKVKSLFIILPIRRTKSLVVSKGTQISLQIRVAINRFRKGVENKAVFPDKKMQ